tara:strand:+ start:1209 stop:2360 length:1152 start_codon:yes stop_codon:yes gene_type:complete
MATRETSYDRLRADTERREEEVKVAVARKEVVTTEAIASLASAGIIIPKATKNVTIGDVENLRQDRVYATRKTTITANYIVEKIPVPSVNNVSVLIASTSNFFNKPKAIRTIFVLDDDGNTILSDDTSEIIVTNMDNYLGGGGGSTNLTIGGDVGANYTLILKDITNNKYYDWNTTEFIDAYSQKNSKVSKIISYRVNPIDGDNYNKGKIQVYIPSQTIETTYNLFFKAFGSTIYNAELPTEASPWVINQLPAATSTFRFEDDLGFTYDQTTVLTKPAGATYIYNNSNTAELGDVNEDEHKTVITITTVAKRGVLALTDKKSINPAVETQDFRFVGGDVVLETDLTASVDGMVGTITGTILFINAPLRETQVLFTPTSIFQIK